VDGSWFIIVVVGAAIRVIIASRHRVIGHGGSSRASELSKLDWGPVRHHQLRDLVVGSWRSYFISTTVGSDKMTERVADFLLDAAVEIILPDDHEERENTRICLCCQRARTWMDDDGCGICDECLAG